VARIISFAWTTAALLAGAKSVTRREWDHEYARRFRAGDVVLAYDRSPRAHGRHVATIQLTQAPTWEALGMMPDSDYEAEGFAWFERHPEELRKLEQRGIYLPVPFARFKKWRQENGACHEWVVRFKLLEVVA